MKRAMLSLAASALALLALAPAAGAEFGLESFDVTFTDPDGQASMQAGSHPYEMTVSLYVNRAVEEGVEVPDGGAVKELVVSQVPGLAGIPDAVPPCSTLDFLTLREGSVSLPECADSSAVGTVEATVGENGEIGKTEPIPLYNLTAAPGTAAKLGFWVANVPTTIDIGVSESFPYNIVATTRNITQMLEFFGADLTIWGNPASPDHDFQRGTCAEFGGTCPAGIGQVPFLTLPRACEGPLLSTYEVNSWLKPASWVSGGALTHGDGGAPEGMSGCGVLGFEPEISSQPTTASAESPTGLAFGVNIDDEGLTNPDLLARAHSDVKKAVVTLPQGVTANPSQAEGLGVCSEADLARERADSGPGEGCPQTSKIGTVEVETPLLKDEVLKGSLYIATPYENPFGSLLALYMTIKSPDLGIGLKLAGKVAPDPRTGQLITTFGDPSSSDPDFRALPQLPFSDFRLRFREGGRSPLITPPGCGTYVTKAEFTPWADPTQTFTTTSAFQVSSGVGGGPCPAAGTPPFAPGFTAGTLNNSAGSYSPFLMRLTRRDGDQDLTRFDATLPRGAVAKLAGVSKCPEAAIALTKAKTGRAELASPSCPANSRIGSILAGAGVGSQLTYVPGSVYLAGPFGKAPLSVVGVVPAVAGPFDVGTVVTRQALTLDPVTAEAKVDGALSDPIPHILAGIPLKVRDIRVSIDRPSFTLNPTSCAKLSVAAALWGGGANPFSLADDAPVSLSDRFQAAGCAALGFKPRLSLKLRGPTKRGGFPSLRAELRARPGDANVGKAAVTLPNSAFLAQQHIRTICTRVQYAADNCPKGSIYGTARAFTPLLDEPLEGPVYLRSSSNPLPDMVAALKGVVDVDLVGRIDSVKLRGGDFGIRSSFEGVPDAPVSKFVLTMQGGKKGLIVNSRSLCTRKSKAVAAFTGQNGKPHKFEPVVKPTCGKQKARKR